MLFASSPLACSAGNLRLIFYRSFDSLYLESILYFTTTHHAVWIFCFRLPTERSRACEPAAAGGRSKRCGIASAAQQGEHLRYCDFLPLFFLFSYCISVTLQDLTILWTFLPSKWDVQFIFHIGVSFLEFMFQHSSSAAWIEEDMAIIKFNSP